MKTKLVEPLATTIVREIYEKHGRDAALAVGAAIYVAQYHWESLDTKKYGEIAFKALMGLTVWTREDE